MNVDMTFALVVLALLGMGISGMLLIYATAG